MRFFLMLSSLLLPTTALEHRGDGWLHLANDHVHHDTAWRSVPGG